MVKEILGSLIGSLIGVLGAYGIARWQFNQEKRLEEARLREEKELFKSTVVSIFYNEIEYNRSKFSGDILGELRTKSDKTQITTHYIIDNNFEFETYNQMKLDLYRHITIPEVSKIIKLYECLYILKKYQKINDVTKNEFKIVRELPDLFDYFSNLF